MPVNKYQVRSIGFLSALKLGFFLLGGLCFITDASAESQLIAGQNTVVTQINDQSMGKGLFTPKSAIYRLGPGTQTVTVRYDKLFNVNADEHDVLRSDGVTTTFNVQDNETYRLGWANEPKSYAEAKIYAKHPILVIYNKAGDVVASQQGELSQTKGFGSIFGKVTTRNRGTVYQSPEVRQQGVVMAAASPSFTSPQLEKPIAAVVQEAVVAAPPTNIREIKVNTVQPTRQGVVSSENMLSVVQVLWKKASPQERQQIAKWILSQGQF